MTKTHINLGLFGLTVFITSTVFMGLSDSFNWMLMSAFAGLLFFASYLCEAMFHNRIFGRIGLFTGVFLGFVVVVLLGPPPIEQHIFITASMFMTMVSAVTVFTTLFAKCLDYLYHEAEKNAVTETETTE